jgi:hypothetical protein
MRLDEDFAIQTLQTPWQNWTPEIAESVRRHFLGPWFHKPHCAEMRLDKVIYWMTAVHSYGPENQRLREAAARYQIQVRLSEAHVHKAQAPDL